MLNTLHGRHSHVYCSLQQWQANIQYFTQYHPPALLKPLIATPLPNITHCQPPLISLHYHLPAPLMSLNNTPLPLSCHLIATSMFVDLVIL